MDSMEVAAPSAPRISRIAAILADEYARLACVKIAEGDLTGAQEMAAWRTLLNDIATGAGTTPDLLGELTQQVGS